MWGCCWLCLVSDSFPLCCEVSCLSGWLHVSALMHSCCVFKEFVSIFFFFCVDHSEQKDKWLFSFSFLQKHCITILYWDILQRPLLCFHQFPVSSGWNLGGASSTPVIMSYFSCNQLCNQQTSGIKNKHPYVITKSLYIQREIYVCVCEIISLLFAL